MAQYSCDGRGILEFREDGVTYLSVNPTTRVPTITKGCPIGAINAVTNHFKAINWGTGGCDESGTHQHWG